MAATLDALKEPDLGDLSPQDDLGAEPEGDQELTSSPPVPLLQTSIAAALAAAGAAWMIGGVFRGWGARGTGVFAALLGAALGYATYRWRRPSLQFLVLPVALLVGAALVAPDAHAGTSSLPGLVVDAIHNGGFLQPPVDFEPGWRLVLTVLLMMLASGAVAVAVTAGRPRLAALVPAPLAVGAALIQPSGEAALSSAVTIVALIAALAVAYGADLGKSSDVGAGFEVRRLGRTGGMIAGLVIAMVVLNQAGFLFPSPQQNRTIPPQRPQVPPAPPDVPLFRVTTNAQAPLRLGVLDVYDVKQNAWLLPPQDSSKLSRKSTPATLPGGPGPANGLTATFTVEQATGHLLPVIGGTERVTGLAGQQFDYDSRQETIRIAGKPLFTGLTYTVEAPLPPSGVALRKANPSGKGIIKDFLVVPPTPLEVRALLDKAPTDNLFDRLQFVRQAFYDKVVASGPGKPVDVSAQRVVQVMQGAEANPYEITGSEALLARWAGIPARIGYGYYGGQPLANGVTEIRPRNGATWLEVYFGQYGWVPIYGTPPHAKPSTRNSQQNLNPAIHPTEQLALIVYLPARLHTLLPIYVVLRYWLLVGLPFAAALLLLIVLYPGLIKRLRRARRHRWGKQQGVHGRVAVAYAEFRDQARDLAIGEPLATPLEFLDYVEPDDQHAELAWLVTRTLYGDMLSTITGEDAAAAEDLANSVSRRLRRAQSSSTRFLAFASRTSLREPFSREVPNLWWRRGRLRAPSMKSGRMAGAVATTLAILLVAGCGNAPAAVARPLPARVVPGQLGALDFVEEPKAEAAYVKAKTDADILVSEGRVFTIHNGDVIEGSIQVSRFKPGYSPSDPGVLAGVEDSLGHFAEFRGARQRVWLDASADQRTYMWFPPKSDALALLILRGAFAPANSDALARALIAYQEGKDPTLPMLQPDVEPTPAPAAAATLPAQP